ncbi:MAG: hypothetical protein QNL04_09835 [SAR324 cluster bacterium]|nr:hypothetical protein [SAR324 cluster bacterium]
MERTKTGPTDVRTGNRTVKLEAKARIIRVLALTFLTVDIVFYLLSKLLFWVGWIDFSFDHASFEGYEEIFYMVLLYLIAFTYI